MIINIANNTVELAIDDEEVVIDVLVLARVQRADEQGSALAYGATEHTDFITELGMLAAFQQAMGADDE